MVSAVPIVTLYHVDLNRSHNCVHIFAEVHSPVLYMEIAIEFQRMIW